MTTAPRAAAVAYARAQIGKPYRLGSAGPAEFDCSGLTMRAWEAAGLDVLSHWTVAQWAETNKRPYSEAEPGDLIFYGIAPAPHHVALYVGNGRQIAAPQPGEDVKEQPCYGGDQIASVGVMPVAGGSVAVPAGTGSTGSTGSSAAANPLSGVANRVTGSRILPWNWGEALDDAQRALTQTAVSWSLKLAFIGGGIALAVIGARAAIPTPSDQ